MTTTTATIFDDRTYASKEVDANTLTGKALDWAVAECQGWSGWNGESFSYKEPDTYSLLFLHSYRPSVDWNTGGPIMESLLDDSFGFILKNNKYHKHQCSVKNSSGKLVHGFGATVLIAAMRAYVAMTLGYRIMVPEHLID